MFPVACFRPTNENLRLLFVAVESLRSARRGVRLWLLAAYPLDGLACGREKQPKPSGNATRSMTEADYFGEAARSENPHLFA